MHLITAHDQHFKGAAKVMRALADQYGWPHLEHKLDDPKVSHDRTGWRYKPDLIEAALADGAATDLLYLDTDAFPVRPVTHVFRQKFDLAVTVRPEHELQSKSDESRAFLGWTNAGVIFARRKALPLIRQWRKRAADAETDQHALNAILHPKGERPVPMTTVERHGWRVLFLPAEIYNHTGPPWPAHPFVRILHLNGGRWREHEDSMRVLAGLAEPREYRA